MNMIALILALILFSIAANIGGRAVASRAAAVAVRAVGKTAFVIAAVIFVFLSLRFIWPIVIGMLFIKLIFA